MMSVADLTKAIIGHTGFVGGCLTAQIDFAGQFNRRNIDQIDAQRFDVAVCAAAPGSMFEANKFPDRDAAAISALQRSLEKLTCDHFVLISTIAVYEDFAGGDDETSTAYQTDTPYGANRRNLEAFCAAQFDKCTIVRLPALFGQGLKKNFLFDMLNPVPSMLTDAARQGLRDLLPTALQTVIEDCYALDTELGMHVVDRHRLDNSRLKRELAQELVDQGRSALSFTNPNSCFQFYPLARIWSDIQVALRHELAAVNLATPPLMAGDIYQAATGTKMLENQARVHREDMRTIHSGAWGARAPYIASKDEIAEELQSFLKQARAAMS